MNEFAQPTTILVEGNDECPNPKEQARVRARIVIVYDPTHRETAVAVWEHAIEAEKGEAA